MGYLILTMIVFDCLTMVFIIGFAMHTLRIVRTRLYILTEPIYEPIRNQIKYRKCQLQLCHILICLYYLFQLMESSAWSLYFVDDDPALL